MHGPKNKIKFRSLVRRERSLLSVCHFAKGADCRCVLSFCRWSLCFYCLQVVAVFLGSAGYRWVLIVCRLSLCS